MKAAVCTAYGPPEVLEVREVPVPIPAAKQVRIRVVATAVTSSDCYLRGLKFPLAIQILARLALGVRAPRQPILGIVVAGEIESVGRDVTSFKEGDQVFGMDVRAFGAYAELMCWGPSAALAPSPANLSYEEAAALPYGGLLALHFLKRLKISPGQHWLVYGASGAVGTSAVQLARHFGCEVTGVCSAANFELVRALGADHVIDYTADGFSLGEGRYDVIFDAAGKRKSRMALADGGKALAPQGVLMSVDDGAPRLSTENLVLIKELAEAGEIKPVIDRRYPLEQIVDAHRFVDQGHKKGNVIVTVTPRPNR